MPEFEFSTGEFRLKPIRKSTYDIEIRIEKIPHGRQRTLLVLTVKDDKIEGNYYYKDADYLEYTPPDSAKNISKWERFPYKKFKLDSSGLKQQLAELIHNNILTLPNQKNLMNGKPFGHFYFVDFKYYDRYRSYSFDKTDKLAVKYPNIREFKDYGEILRLSEKLTEDFEKFTSVKE